LNGTRESRHHRAIGDLARQREELERRVDDLRAFERDYRSRLQAFVEGGLRVLLGDGGSNIDYGVCSQPSGSAPASGARGLPPSSWATTGLRARADWRDLRGFGVS
jgi:hypothetical protein